jgi:hypothetical protein
MKSLQDNLYPKTVLTPKAREAINEVYDIAAAYCALEPHRQRPFLGEVRKLTTGRQRWLATHNTPPDHSCYAPLMTLLDALIADQGLWKTKTGWFSRDELDSYRVRFERDDTGELIVFPVLYPWFKKPDENGQGGEPAAPVYRHKDDRHPYRGTFSQAGPREADQVKDFWDE